MPRWLRVALGQAPVSPDVALLVLRVCFGLTMALQHGLGKFSRIESFGAKITGWGVPLGQLWALCAALSETVGALLIAVGLLARPAAGALLFTMSVAAFVAHGGDPFKKKELALAFWAVSLAVVIAGPGRYSVDAWLLGRSRPKR